MNRSRRPVMYLLSWYFAGAPGRIRTRDRLLRRQLLYPAELRAPGNNCARLRSHDGYTKVAVSCLVAASAPVTNPGRGNIPGARTSLTHAEPLQPTERTSTSCQP
jgi:hypothetical protein